MSAELDLAKRVLTSVTTGGMHTERDLRVAQTYAAIAQAARRWSPSRPRWIGWRTGTEVPATLVGVGFEWVAVFCAFAGGFVLGSVLVMAVLWFGWKLAAYCEAHPDEQRHALNPQHWG